MHAVGCQLGRQTLRPALVRDRTEAQRRARTLDTKLGGKADMLRAAVSGWRTVATYADSLVRLRD
jgi:hypothetical protein